MDSSNQAAGKGHSSSYVSPVFFFVSPSPLRGLDR